MGTTRIMIVYITVTKCGHGGTKILYVHTVYFWRIVWLEKCEISIQDPSIKISDLST